MRGMSPLSARWSCSPYSFSAADAISSALGVSTTTAAILVRRGIDTPAAARRFLAADERHPALALPGLRAGCERILDHLRRGSRIVVHGDYDADGVCSTALLVRALRRLGADPTWHLPSRFDEGYGLSAATVERLAAAGTGLLITVDCGATAVAEVEQAVARGMEVVVTDHHQPGSALPACPVIHPGIGSYPFPDLCATAVAHKLAEGLLELSGRDPAAAAEDLDLVALATVADVVPLVGENRALVRAGLSALAHTSKAGLLALMRVASVDPGRVQAHALGFALAPRLNAAGRLGRADAALELLLTDDRERADQVADELDVLNRERRDVEGQILLAAEAVLADQPEANGYVVAGTGWHPGVIGIVASRLVERHGRPCVLIALDGDGLGRGSGRSIPAYDLHAGLAAGSEHLVRFGGHRQAAGLEIRASEVEAFRAAFVEHATASLSSEDLRAVTAVDALAGVDALGMELVEELERLAPFGHGNPRPTLLVPGVRVADVRSVGGEGQHCSLTVSSGGARARVMAFRTPAEALSGIADVPCDAAVRPEVSEWQGVVEPLLVLQAACPTEAGPVEPLGGEPFWSGLARELRALDQPVPAAGFGVQPRLAQAGMGAATASLDRREPNALSLFGLPTSLTEVRSSRSGAGVTGPAGSRPSPTAARPVRANGNGLATGAAQVRAMRDRRGAGLAGVAGDLLSSGESLLIVCAHVARRRAAVERLLGGLVRGGPDASERSALTVSAAPEPEPGPAEAFRQGFALTDWAALEREPELAGAFTHVLALDPPEDGSAERRLAALPGPLAGSFAHLAWGEPERAFALAVAESELDLGTPLRELYRTLDARPVRAAAGPELRALLEGGGVHPRSPSVAARLVRVLVELGQAVYDPAAAAGPALRLLPPARTEITRSATYQATQERLAGVRRTLSPHGPAQRVEPASPRPPGPRITARPIPTAA